MKVNIIIVMEKNIIYALIEGKSNLFIVVCVFIFVSHGINLLIRSTK